MGVIEGRPEKLTPWWIFVDRSDAATNQHLGRVDRFAGAEPAQRGAEGPQQKHGFCDVALRLLDRQRRKGAIIESALAHDPIDTEPELFADLRHRKLGHRTVAASLLRNQLVRFLDRRL